MSSNRRAVAVGQKQEVPQVQTVPAAPATGCQCSHQCNWRDLGLTDMFYSVTCCECHRECTHTSSALDKSLM